FMATLLFSIYQAEAQTNINARGKVLSTSGEAVDHATIEVIGLKSKFKSVVSSNDNGIFELHNLSSDEQYNLYIHHVSFQPDSIMDFTVQANQSNSLLIRLKPSQAALDEIVVV